MADLLPPLKPIPIKDRLSILYIEYGHLDVLDGAFVVVDKTGVRTHIPVGGVACLMLEPGTRVSHAACALAARVGTLLVWIGEAGVRLYSAGQPGGARSDKLLYQARLALDDSLRLKVIRKMYALRFGEEPPQRRSVEQLRGIEGARVRETYKRVAAARCRTKHLGISRAARESPRYTLSAGYGQTMADKSFGVSMQHNGRVLTQVPGEQAYETRRRCRICYTPTSGASLMPSPRQFLVARHRRQGRAHRAPVPGGQVVSRLPHPGFPVPDRGFPR